MLLGEVGLKDGEREARRPRGGGVAIGVGGGAVEGRRVAGHEPLLGVADLQLDRAGEDEEQLAGAGAVGGDPGGPAARAQGFRPDRRQHREALIPQSPLGLALSRVPELFIHVRHACTASNTSFHLPRVIAYLETH